MKSYDDPPVILDETLRGIALKSQALLDTRQYGKAQQGFEKIYKLLLSNQPIGRRYHKGYALHNEGVAAFYSGKPQKAFKCFLLAYIEDLLSQEEGNEETADSLPAGKNLSEIYLINTALFESLRTMVQNFKASKTVIQDPEQIVKGLDINQSKYLSDKTKALKVTETPRKPGQFQSEWENRVFVGGSYDKHVAELSRIADICEELGFDPIIASRFQTPPERFHHHALMLLHECKTAIFEVSDDVGQLMEIERLRDYQVSALMLSQKNKNRLSAMLNTLFDSSDCQFEQYGSIKEMETHIRRFLKAEKGRSKKGPTRR